MPISSVHTSKPKKIEHFFFIFYIFTICRRLQLGVRRWENIINITTSVCNRRSLYDQLGDWPKLISHQTNSHKFSLIINAQYFKFRKNQQCGFSWNCLIIKFKNKTCFRCFFNEPLLCHALLVCRTKRKTCPRLVTCQLRS